MSKQQSKVSSFFNHRYFRLMIYTLITGIIIVALLFFYISKALLPDTEELENPKYEIEEAIQTISNKFSTLNDEYLRMSNVGERIRIDNERY